MPVNSNHPAPDKRSRAKGSSNGQDSVSETTHAVEHTPRQLDSPGQADLARLRRPLLIVISP